MRGLAAGGRPWGTDPRQWALHWIIGFVLTRARAGENANPDGDTTANPDDASQQQRINVVGDGDFLSNAYLGNGGNLDLGLNMVHWLSNDDSFIAIRAKTSPDQSFTLTTTAQIAIGAGFLFGLPLLLLGSGVYHLAAPSQTLANRTAPCRSGLGRERFAGRARSYK